MYTVSGLNEYVKVLLESATELQDVAVTGELSNYKIYPSGHHYFSLKDEQGALRCVCFRGAAAKIDFQPENGMHVIAKGRVSVFPRDGAYQLYVNQLVPQGLGDLHIAFQKLKEKLYGEGLFDQSHKQPIPRFPGKIALITSESGAAIRDMIRVLGTRYPVARILVVPVRVQGKEAPREIADAINYVNQICVADLIITGRGGGSMEDLWAFNDEAVARAIFASQIPIISAVGHEPDVTIADFAADLRAATPSHAAQLAVPHMDELRELLDSNQMRMQAAVQRRLGMSRERLEYLAGRPVLTSPVIYLEQQRQTLTRAKEQLGVTFMQSMTARREQHKRLAATLDALSPLKVLGRGYSVVKNADGKVIRTVGDAELESKIDVTLRHGALRCVVKERLT